MTLIRHAQGGLLVAVGLRRNHPHARIEIIENFLLDPLLEVRLEGVVVDEDDRRAVYRLLPFRGEEVTLVELKLSVPLLEVVHPAVN